MYSYIGQDAPAVAGGKLSVKEDPIAQYGNRMSELIWKAVNKAEPGTQRIQMMAILDALDPTLWDVVNTKALRFQKEKKYPPKKALKRALAAAFANNMVKSLVATGKTGSVPLQGLLGLGIYGAPAQIGAYLNYRQGLGSAFAVQMVATNAVVASDAYKCAQEGKSLAPCHYERARAGVVGDPGPKPKPGFVWVCGGCATASQRGPKVMKDADGNCPPGYIGTRAGTCLWKDKRCEPGFSYAWDVKGCVPFAERPGRDMVVGPFFFDSTKENQNSSVYHGTRAIPADWKKFLADEVRAHALYKHQPQGFRLGEQASKFGIDKWLGFKDDFNIRFDKEFFNGEKPLVKFKHPIDGKSYGLFLVAKKDKIYAVAHPYKKKKGWWGKLWGKIKSIGAKIIGAVKDVIEAAAGLACKVMNHPAGAAAAGAGAVAVGAPPQAAIAGTQVAQGLCAEDVPITDIPLMEPQTPPWLLPAAIGGGALLLILALKKKKKS